MRGEGGVRGERGEREGILNRYKSGGAILFMRS